MGWDWWTYYEQPPEFIADILEHIKVDAEFSKGKHSGAVNDNGVSSDPDNIFNAKVE